MYLHGFLHFTIPIACLLPKTYEPGSRGYRQIGVMDHFGANITRPPCLHPALRTSEAVTATLGLLLNVTLALLIVSRTEKELRPYGRVLLCNCCVDGVFSLLAYVFEIVRPQKHMLETAKAV